MITTDQETQLRSLVNDLDTKAYETLDLIEDLDRFGDIDLYDEEELDEIKTAIEELQEKITNWQESKGYI